MGPPAAVITPMPTFYTYYEQHQITAGKEKLQPYPICAPTPRVTNNSSEG